MVFSTYKTDGFWLTLWGYYDNTLYTLYTLYTLVISVEDDLRLGYQRRRRLIFRLSASKMILSWVTSFEDDLFLGYQRRR